jgi:ABC-type multidrug transport system permease subunit
VEFPYILVQSLIYGTIFYSLGSFEWTAAKFLWFLFFMYFTLLYFTFYGMMTTAITPNHTVAPIIAAPFYTLWNLFSGFMIPRKVWGKLPPYNWSKKNYHPIICALFWFFNS